MHFSISVSPVLYIVQISRDRQRSTQSCASSIQRR